MKSLLIFNFKTDISKVNIPTELNNPFQVNLSELSKIAAKEFQDYITQVSPNWEYDFTTRPGKMFGVLVIQKKDKSYGFLGAMSGNLPGNKTDENCIPSVFDESIDDYFFNKGMKEISVLTNKLRASNQLKLVNELKKTRSQKSKDVQRKLFKHFNFLNVLNQEKNIIPIFKDGINGNPPAGSGECAAPKLLHYAFKNQLKAIALAEFWWGNPTKNQKKVHKAFYPACKNKCQPILEYMLDDSHLYDNAKLILEDCLA